MNNDLVKELRELADVIDKATPGPWVFGDENDQWVSVELGESSTRFTHTRDDVYRGGYSISRDEKNQNAQAIVAARNLAPALLREAAEALAKLQDHAQPIATAKLKTTEGIGLILDRSDDGDVWVTVQGNMRLTARHTARVCTRQGGGTAPNVLRALYALMSAIQEDGGDVTPFGVPL